MENKYEIINATIYDPKNSTFFKTSRKEKESCSTIECNNKDNCNLYKRGQCLRVGMFGEACPYGRNYKEEGFTKNAKGYNNWLNERIEKYNNVLNKISYATDIMERVGDYVYLPYSHIAMNTNVPFLRHDLYLRSGIKLIKAEDFNLTNINLIVSFRPQAMMGGEITSYQKDIVPKFILHLSEKFPELYNELIVSRPELKITKENVSYIGRKAKLSTVKIGSIFTHHKGAKYEETWTWDGEFMNYTGKQLSFPIVELDEVSIRLKPKKDAIIKIENNDQVTENTIFLD